MVSRMELFVLVQCFRYFFSFASWLFFVSLGHAYYLPLQIVDAYNSYSHIR